MWDSVDIVALTEALQHARMPETTEIEDLQLKLRHAHAIVLDHVSRDDAAWTATMLAWTTVTAPPAIYAAILCQFLDLVRHRGDDEPSRASGLTLSPYVTRLLLRYHDPAIA